MRRILGWWLSGIGRRDRRGGGDVRRRRGLLWCTASYLAGTGDGMDGYRIGGKTKNGFEKRNNNGLV